MKGQEGIFWDNENVLNLERRVGYTGVCICQSPTSYIPLRYTHAVVCKSYLQNIYI